MGGRNPGFAARAAGMAALWAVMAGAAAGSESVAGDRRGLSTTFVEVQLEGVPIGSRYALDAKPVDVENRSDYTMTIHLEALAPRPDELRGGYDPVPDPAWVQFEPRDFTVSAGGRVAARLVINAPDDPALIGRRFEASVFIRGVPVESPAVGVGLKPRVYFSLGGRDGPERIVTMNTAPRFPRVTPYETGVRAGTMRFAAAGFTAQNQTGGVLTYDIAPDAAAVSGAGDGGAELLPDLTWVTVSPRTLILAPWQSAHIAVEVNLPIDARLFGRTFFVPLRTVARGGGAPPVDVHNRMVVVVPDPGKLAGAGLP